MATDKRLKAIVADIRKFCKANTNEETVKKYAKFFTEGYDAYGIDKDIYLEKAKNLVESLKDAGGVQDIYPLAQELLSSGKYEEASFAVHYAMGFKDQFTKADFQKLGAWFENGIINWGHTDVLCGEVLDYLILKKIVSYEDMSAWRESSSKWKRRAVPVSMIGLAKQSKSIKPLLSFIEPLMHDEDRFVQQGLGWFLREAWKKNPKPVEALLLKYKNSAPRKIYQYATEKMSKEQKELYRKDKKK